MNALWLILGGVILAASARALDGHIGGAPLAVVIALCLTWFALNRRRSP